MRPCESRGEEGSIFGFKEVMVSKEDKYKLEQNEVCVGERSSIIDFRNISGKLLRAYFYLTFINYFDELCFSFTVPKYLTILVKSIFGFYYGVCASGSQTFWFLNPSCHKCCTIGS